MMKDRILYFILLFTVMAATEKQVPYKIARGDNDAMLTVDCSDDNVFACNVKKTECVSSSMKCDGITDCKNGFDESVEICGCLPHEFQCNKTYCIDKIKRCDLTQDCPDGNDEEDCETFVCPLTHFKCSNHMCVPMDALCDFVNDCGDNSDEIHCTRRRCGYGDFTCDNMECTKSTNLCDGNNNCKDGSDEDPKHCDAHFRCPTGLYVGMDTLCDGWIDCLITHVDEVKCEECKAPKFQCSNGECINEGAKCDGVCDCTSCDDEADCDDRYCDPRTHYLCHKTHRCIQHRFMCDGINHCKNTGSGIDEFFCHNTSDCSTFPYNAPFRCPEGRCLNTNMLCNHYWDCLGGEDEQGCDFPECHTNQYRCDNGKCIDGRKQCDAINDCLDWSDETNCENFQCSKNHSKCNSGQCIPSFQWCNHWPNCPDGSDEDECEYKMCGKDEFTCNNGECVPLTALCYNGKQREGHGCQDRSHLIHCENHTCQDKEFKCRKSFCIDQDQVCNGVPDCFLNFVDEMNCEYSCPYNEFENNCSCLGEEMNCEGLRLKTLALPSKYEPITKFRLSGNEFGSTLNSTTFSQAGSHLYSTTHLDLSNNSMTQIPDNIFQYMWRLKYLNLGNNSLTEIKRTSLTGLKKLTQLYLNGNDITRIENGSFLDLGQLTILDLSQQNLTSIGPNIFKGLHNLHLLNLSGNRLEDLPDGAFNGLSNLLTLDLSNNDIQNIGKRAFYGIPKLSLLITDEYRFCCLARDVEKCLPEPDEFSSCEDLMSNHILRIFIWILGLFASCGNLVVIVWRARDMRGRKVHSLLITNLAIGDFLMGVYLVIIAAVDSYYRGVYMLHDKAWRHSSLCHFAGFISTFSSELSVLTLTIITLDRLVCIIFPLRLTRLSVRDATVAMVFAWLIVFFISLVPLMGIPYFQNFYGRSGVCLALHVTPARPPGWQFSVAVFLVFNFLSFLIIAASYIWMFLVAKETRSAVRSPETKSDAAMAKRMTLIVMTDFACWVPIILLGFASLGGANASNNVYAWIAVFILPLNSAVNPALYTLSTAPFLGNARTRAYKFRKSFLSTGPQETKNSFIDDRTFNSYTERRPGETMRMKNLRTSIQGHSSQNSNDL